MIKESTESIQPVETTETAAFLNSTENIPLLELPIENDQFLEHAENIQSVEPIKSVKSAQSTHIRICILCSLSILILVGLSFNFRIFYRVPDFKSQNSRHIAEQLKLLKLNQGIHNVLPHRKFDIVLSYYAEDPAFVARYIQYLRNVSNIQKLNPRVIVYNKNLKANIAQLNNTLLPDIVRTLPNFGREGATYLTHIVENYDSIADHILFSQAGVEGITGTGLADWYFARLQHQFNSSVGYMPLVSNDWITTYDCGVNPPTGNFPQLTELWGIVEHTLCPPGGQAVSFRGQFLVSGKRIRSRPLSVYKYLLDIITANNSHWIHLYRVNPDTRSTQDNPLFGHVIERFWTILFNCSKADLLEKCRQSNCKCLD